MFLIIRCITSSTIQRWKLWALKKWIGEKHTDEEVSTGLPICFFLKADFEIMAFLMHLGFLKIKKAIIFFLLERLDWEKAMSELHIHCKSLLMRVCDHAGYKENYKDFTVALKCWMYVITKQGTLVQSRGSKMFLKTGVVLHWCFKQVLISILCLVMRVLYVYALWLLSSLFGTRSNFFWWTCRQPWWGIHVGERNGNAR